jgi:hypothetical protein
MKGYTEDQQSGHISVRTWAHGYDEFANCYSAGHFLNLVVHDTFTSYNDLGVLWSVSVGTISGDNCATQTVSWDPYDCPYDFSGEVLECPSATIVSSASVKWWVPLHTTGDIVLHQTNKWENGGTRFRSGSRTYSECANLSDISSASSTPSASPSSSASGTAAASTGASRTASNSVTASTSVSPNASSSSTSSASPRSTETYELSPSPSSISVASPSSSSIASPSSSSVASPSSSSDLRSSSESHVPSKIECKQNSCTQPKVCVENGDADEGFTCEAPVLVQVELTCRGARAPPQSELDADRVGDDLVRFLRKETDGAYPLQVAAVAYTFENAQDHATRRLLSWQDLKLSITLHAFSDVGAAAFKSVVQHPRMSHRLEKSAQTSSQTDMSVSWYGSISVDSVTLSNVDAQEDKGDDIVMLIAVSALVFTALCTILVIFVAKFRHSRHKPYEIMEMDKLRERFGNPGITELRTIRCERSTRRQYPLSDGEILDTKTSKFDRMELRHERRAWMKTRLVSPYGMVVVTKEESSSDDEGEGCIDKSEVRRYQRKCRRARSKSRSGRSRSRGASLIVSALKSVAKGPSRGRMKGSRRSSRKERNLPRSQSLHVFRSRASPNEHCTPPQQTTPIRRSVTMNLPGVLHEMESTALNSMKSMTMTPSSCSRSWLVASTPHRVSLKHARVSFSRTQASEPELPMLKLPLPDNHVSSTMNAQALYTSGCNPNAYSSDTEGPSRPEP